MERQLDYNIFDLLPKAPFTSDYFNTSLNPGFKNGFTDSISPNYIRDGAVYGILQSANFQTGIEGWQIKPNGDVEFNDGVFRGTIQIGGQYITVATTGSIQSAIDTVYAGGGGVVILQSGVHTVASDITLYSNVSLIGQSASASIIDFNGGAYQIKVIGSDAYSTGTVSISNNGTTVTGSGTSWTGNITAGQYIMLSGIWYPVTNVGGNTTLTIGLPYGGPTLSGATYISASIVTSSKIQYLTVKNSTTAAIKTMYTNEFFMDDVEIQASGTAIDMDYCSQSTIINFDSIACTNGVDMNECHFFSMNANGALDNTNNGWTIANSTNLAISSAFVLNCGGDGMNLTSVTDTRIDGVFNENGGQGIEFVSGCNRIFLVNSGIQNNTSDGIKLTATSDNVNIQSSFVIGNGGYGVNISASSCDNAVITGNNFSTNTSGAVNDLGTGTVIRGNVGVTDNATGNLASAKFGGGGTDGALSVSSGNTNIDCGGARILVKNYSSISITGTASVTFTNPHSQGTTVILRCSGDFTVTSSTAPALICQTGSIGGTGGSGGVGSLAATNGSSLPTNGGEGTLNVEVLYSGNYAGTGGVAYNSTGAQTAGTGGTTKGIQLDTSTNAASFYSISVERIQKNKFLSITPGYGGGAGSGGSGARSSGSTTGGTGGDGGRGGGALIIECAGTWNFTTTNGISVGGINGSNGANITAGNGAGGGGGGGGGGMFIALYNTLGSNTGTVIISGGSGGSGGTASGTATLTGAGGGGGGQGGGAYNGAATNGSDGIAGSGTSGGSGGSGGGGATGYSLITKNIFFA